MSAQDIISEPPEALENLSYLPPQDGEHKETIPTPGFTLQTPEEFRDDYVAAIAKARYFSKFAGDWGVRAR